jgi:hypothetical protein
MEAFAVILVIIFLFLLIFYLNKRKVRNQFTSTISVATNAAPDYSQQPSPIKRLKPKMLPAPLMTMMMVQADKRF